MKIFRVNGNEYEIYLSSNGVLRIEEEMGCSIYSLNADKVTKIGYKSMIVLLYGILWQRNKLSLDSVADLVDEWIENNDISEIGSIIKNELQNWSAKMKKNKAVVDDKKK